MPIKPLSINDAHKGRHFKTVACKDYEFDLWRLLKKQGMVMGIVAIHYRFHLVNHALTDYDNLIKITQDILVKKRYIEDDRKIYRAVIDKVPSDIDFFEVTIEPLALAKEVC